VSKLSAKVFFKITHRNWVDHHLPSGTVKTCVQCHIWQQWQNRR